MTNRDYQNSPLFTYDLRQLGTTAPVWNTLLRSKILESYLFGCKCTQKLLILGIFECTHFYTHQPEYEIDMNYQRSYRNEIRTVLEQYLFSCLPISTDSHSRNRPLKSVYTFSLIAASKLLELPNQSDLVKRVNVIDRFYYRQVAEH